ncbi:MAG: DUF4430 domain-containing protein [Pirellulales bacterium]
MIERIRRALGSKTVLAVFALMALLAAAPPPMTIAADDKAQTVELVVDYGDQAQVRLAALPWRDEMTVLDAMETAQKHPHGITFAQRGSGASTLITQIDDVKNQGAGKNWLYSVNGKLGTVGVGAYRLKPRDAILWEFKVYE